jgi:MYXO-CTERM domain-containing protein
MSPRDRQAKDQEKAAQQAGKEAAQDVKDRTGVGKVPPSDPQALREEIQETREGLGDTVDALAQKADVKAQAQEKIAERKEQLRETQEQAKEKAAEVAEQARQRPPVLVAGAMVLALLLLWRIRRR